MDEIEIKAVPKFMMTVSKERAQVIRKMAANHCDLTCKGAAYQGGFVQWWLHSMSKQGQSEVVAILNFRELDLLSKILENHGVLSLDEYEHIKNLRGLIALAINKFSIEAANFSFKVQIK